MHRLLLSGQKRRYVGSGGRAQLAEHARDVGGDDGRAQPEIGGNFTVASPGRDETCDVSFGVGQDANRHVATVDRTPNGPLMWG